MTDMRGRVCVVTGGSRGIGRGIVQAMLDEGASVVATARTEEGLRRLRDELDAGERLHCVAGMVTDPQHRRDVIQAALAAFGSVDYLVNNVSLGTREFDLLADNDDYFLEMLNTNVVAARAWVREAWHGWMGEHGGSVVNVASIAGLRNEKTIGIYGVSKAALIHLTRQLALELAPLVRVNAVAPGLVLTSATERVRDRLPRFEAAYPLGRVGVPEDIAPTVCHLLSDRSSWITGQVIALDGGFTLTTAPVQPEA